MKGLTPVEVVETRLQEISLPSLFRPPVLPHEEPTEELVLWGINYYVYSVLAHMKSILAGLAQLARQENIPAAYILCRHVFEWAAQTCYMSRNLKNYIARKGWKRAWNLQTTVETGNLWIKKHGSKYGSAELTKGLPDPLTIANVIHAYGQFLKKERDKDEDEADDSYGILSEHSHPNSACLVFYREYFGSEVRFTTPRQGSPLPVVNWCLIDLMLFLHELLGLSHEKFVRIQLTEMLREIAKLAPARKR